MQSIQGAPTTSAFTPRERTQYVELVNDQLRAVQIQNQKTFSVFASALQSLSDSTQTPPALQPDNEGISRCIENLTEMLKEPEMYATAEHHEEFRSIIRDRVAAKIRELEVLAKDEKAGQTYIEQQQKSRKEAQDHLETMRAAHKPAQGSEAHVVSEEENLRQQAAFWRRQEMEAAEFHPEYRGEQNWQLFVHHLRMFGGAANHFFTSTADLEQRAADIAASILSSIWEEETGLLTLSGTTLVDTGVMTREEHCRLTREFNALEAEALVRLTAELQHRQNHPQS